MLFLFRVQVKKKTDKTKQKTAEKKTKKIGEAGVSKLCRFWFKKKYKYIYKRNKIVKRPILRVLDMVDMLDGTFFFFKGGGGGGNTKSPEAAGPGRFSSTAVDPPWTPRGNRWREIEKKGG